jgi:predicted nucleic acid-binding protein
MIVVDASAVGAVAFLEPQADAVRRAITGAELAAPRLLPFELANIARNKIRKRPDAIPVLTDQLRDALAVSVALYDVNHLEVFALAAAHNLTAYDASYLWLARHLGTSLVTLDGDLERAVKRMPAHSPACQRVLPDRDRRARETSGRGTPTPRAQS